MPPSPTLLLDTGSPLVSVALAIDGVAVAFRSVEQHRSSTLLLDLVREVLDEAGVSVRELGGIAVLRGPGSFTGLRIGLATVLGLHQVLEVPATALPSLRVMAAAVPAEEGETVIAAVDALRGDWSAQAFAAGPVPRPLGEMALVPGAELPFLAGGRPSIEAGIGAGIGAGIMAGIVAVAGIVAGFGVARLADLPGWPAGLRLAEPGPLAPAAARIAADPGTEWNAHLLTSAIYSRPPAISLPRPRAAPASSKA